MKYCECGCGQEIKFNRRFVSGHNSRIIVNGVLGIKGRIPWNKGLGKIKSSPQLCECGCGQMTSPNRKFIHGHNNHQSSWNAGLTSKTDNRIKIFAESRKGIPSTRKNYKHTETTRQKMSANHADFRGTKRSEESKAKMRKPKREGHGAAISRALKGRIVSQETRQKIREATLGIKQSLETIEKRTKKNKIKWENPEYRIKRTQLIRQSRQTESSRKNTSIASKKMWKDEKHNQKIREAWSIHPNKPETVILNLLEKMYPGEWKFTGDFSFVINGKNPDFTNINGQKKLIELFGNYWHRGEDPQDRINEFLPFGWQTLVIWESELKDKQALINKIQNFHCLK